MSDLRRAQVIFKEKPAGLLEELPGGGSRFSYIDDSQAQIACCFPLERREHDWPLGLHPFFQQLGSEGWLREEQARSASIQEEDDFGLLLKYGADCIGAVGVTPSDPRHVDVQATEAKTSPGRTISGVQKKLLVVLGPDKVFRPAGPTGTAPYIAKFNSSHVDSLVRNENLSLKWCVAVLGRDQVTNFETGRVAVLNEPALIVKRFDRMPDGTKLRLEDFTQILCKPRGRAYQGKYEASYEEVASGIKEYSVRPEIDLARFFHRLIVFVLIGNCDGHLKNFSLLETSNGLRLSPLYDVLNTAIYEHYDQNFALSIQGSRKARDAIDRSLLMGFGESIGLSKQAVTQSFKNIAARVKVANSQIQPTAATAPGEFLDRYFEIVRSTCSRILTDE